MRQSEPVPFFTAAALGRLAIAIGSVATASILGQIATIRSLGDWYVTLAKPGFTPPNIVFPIVWPILYALMALAFWRILRLPAATPGRSAAIRLFFAQLAFNAGWSWAFFGFRNPLAGLFVIFVLEALILLSLSAFWRLDRAAGACLAPYALWVAFATALNAAIVFLNP